MKFLFYEVKIGDEKSPRKQKEKNNLKYGMLREQAQIK